MLCEELQIQIIQKELCV